MDKMMVIKKSNRGFTLIEIMIAIVILSTMATVLITNVTGQQKKARVSQAKILISQVVNAIEMFYRDCASYPTNAEGLEALVARPTDRCPSWGPEPYLSKGRIPTDPWGGGLVYEYDENTDSFEVFSLGSDKKEGGEGYATDLSSADL